MDPYPLLLSLQLALTTTVVLFLLALPISYFLAFHKQRWTGIVEVFLGMPLVLPPTVLGFYLLILLGSGSVLGQFFEDVFGLSLVFSFPGLVVASVVYSLPFMVYPITSGLRTLPSNMLDSARILGKSEWNIFYRVMLPNIRQALLTASILTFAHTIGEFGVVLMIGGSIPQETRVASIAVYEQVELLNYNEAHMYSVVLIVTTFLILGLVKVLNGRRWL